MDFDWIKEKIRHSNPHSASATSRFLDEVYQRTYDGYAYSGPRRLSTVINDVPSYIASFERFRLAAEIRKMAERMLTEHHTEEERIGALLRARMSDEQYAAMRSRVCATRKMLPRDRRCFVAFDIPECQHPARDNFRYFLKKAGLIRKQKSIWETERNIADELRSLFVVGSLGRWIGVEVTAGN